MNAAKIRISVRLSRDDPCRKCSANPGFSHSRCMRDLDDWRMGVYRFFDDGGRCLYVGASNNLGRRLREHTRGTPYWPAVRRIGVTVYGCRRAMLDAERRAIIAVRPVHNVQPDEHARRRLASMRARQRASA